MEQVIDGAYTYELPLNHPVAVRTIKLMNIPFTPTNKFFNHCINDVSFHLPLDISEGNYWDYDEMLRKRGDDETLFCSELTRIGLPTKVCDEYLITRIFASTNGKEFVFPGLSFHTDDNTALFGAINQLLIYTENSTTGGDLFLKSEDGEVVKIKTTPSEGMVKVIAMRGNVLHEVEEISGKGKRSLLIFSGRSLDREIS